MTTKFKFEFKLHPDLGPYGTTLSFKYKNITHYMNLDHERKEIVLVSSLRPFWWNMHKLSGQADFAERFGPDVFAGMMKLLF